MWKFMSADNQQERRDSIRENLDRIVISVVGSTIVGSALGAYLGHRHIEIQDYVNGTIIGAITGSIVGIIYSPLLFRSWFSNPQRLHAKNN